MGVFSICVSLTGDLLLKYTLIQRRCQFVFWLSVIGMQLSVSLPTEELRKPY